MSSYVELLNPTGLKKDTNTIKKINNTAKMTKTLAGWFSMGIFSSVGLSDLLDCLTVGFLSSSTLEFTKKK